MAISKITGKKYRYRLLFKFLLSYMLVLVIPILIGGTIYFIASKIITEEVSNSKMLMLRQASHSVDLSINEVQQMSMAISMNYSVEDFLNVNYPLNENDRYKAVCVSRDLHQYSNSNHFIYDFYIYFKNVDRIITSNAVYPPDYFYSHVYSYNNMSFSSWHDDMLTRTYYDYYRPSEDFTVNTRWKDRMITYIKSIPIYDAKNPAGTLVVLIKEDNIKTLLNDIAQDGAAYIIDGSSNIILSASGVKDIRFPDKNVLKGQSGLVNYKIAGKEMVVTYTTSAMTQWKYVSLVPKDIFMAKANYIMNTTLLVTGICFILGILTAILLAFRNYTPIRHMVDSLYLGIGDMPSGKGNELDFINKIVVSTINRNKQLEQTQQTLLEQNREYREHISANWPVARNGIFAGIVKGCESDYERLKDWFRLYNIEFPYKKFAVILFHIDNWNTLYLSETWKLTKYAVTHSAEDFAGRDGKAYVCELEHDTFSLILNYPEDLEYNSMKEKIFKLSSEIKAFCKEQYDTALTVGIGCPCKRLEEINQSYKEAVKALDYRIVKGNSTIIHYDEIVDRDKGYFYPIDHELKLINSIKAGDIEQCNSLLENIFEENFGKRKLPLNLIKCLFFDIMSTAIKTLDEIKIIHKDIFPDEYEPVENLIRCETVNEMLLEIKKVYGNICLYISSRKAAGNTSLKESILQYVNEHYFEESFSQTAMADSLGITAQYLSKVFKQETGQNMVDYINRLRIEKAKYFMQDKQLPISDIARKVGYCNDRTLIRIFKQYDGITPGKYRAFLSVQR